MRRMKVDRNTYGRDKGKENKRNAERKVTPRVVRKEQRHRRTQKEETKGKSN